MRAFIEPETSISSSTLRGRGRRFKRAEPQHLAVVAHAVAQGAAQVGERARGARACADGRAAAAGARAPRAHSRRSASLVARCVEAALDQRLGARGGQAGFVGLVGERRLVLAAALLLQPHDLLVLALGGFDRLAAEEMDVEQPS